MITTAYMELKKLCNADWFLFLSLVLALNSCPSCCCWNFFKMTLLSVASTLGVTEGFLEILFWADDGKEAIGDDVATRFGVLNDEVLETDIDLESLGRGELLHNIDNELPNPELDTSKSDELLLNFLSTDSTLISCFLFSFNLTRFSLLLFECFSTKLLSDRLSPCFFVENPHLIQVTFSELVLLK